MAMMNQDNLIRKYFNFDEADLFTNRHGALTPKQQTRLEENEKIWKKFLLVGGLILLIIAIVPSITIGLEAASCISNLCSEWPLSLRIFLTGMVVIWMPIWGYFGIRVIRSALSPYNPSTLQKVEGPINIVKENSYNSTSHTYSEDYELHVGGVEFDCDSELADVMMQGDIYAIYYIKGTNEIMSVEILAKAGQTT
jgi:hypothetical protein